MVSKQSQVIDNLLSSFCRYVISCLSSSFSLLFVLSSEVILSAILFPIKSPAVSAVFLTTRLEEVS